MSVYRRHPSQGHSRARVKKRSHPIRASRSRRRNFVLPIILKSTLARFTRFIRSHKKIVGLWFVLGGVLLIAFPVAFKGLGTLGQNQNATRPNTPNSSQNTPPQAREPIRIDAGLLTPKVSTQPPLRIVIPGYSVDLPVQEAKIVNGYWELSETTASHGVGSANPGELGNTVIFAHARDGLFLPIKDIKRDSNIYVLTKDRWFRYRVTETKLVDPNQVETIAPTKDETLTLFTCSGFLDSKRLVVVAKPFYP